MGRINRKIYLASYRQPAQSIKLLQLEDLVGRKEKVFVFFTKYIRCCSFCLQGKKYRSVTLCYFLKKRLTNLFFTTKYGIISQEPFYCPVFHLSPFHPIAANDMKAVPK